MTLSPAQIAARDGRLTASRVACLMTGDREKIMAVWRDLVGDPDGVDDDLSGVWPVRLGETTETLNLDWYERRTGRPVIRRGEVVLHPKAEWAACTLDGWDSFYPCPVEAKHVGGRESLTTIVQRYQPQLHWQMIVTGASMAALSVIEGANAPVVEHIAFDEAYGAELWRRAEMFMACVWAMTPPFPLEPASTPVRAERVYDMAGSNEWGSDAAAWLAHRDAKKTFEAAEKNLKALVPSDAARCHGYGIEAKRDRANRLSIREFAQ